MHRSVLVASLLLVAAPAAARASAAPTGKRPPAHPSRAQVILVHMIAALHRESRVQALGWANGKGQPSTRYRLRYQATAREDYQASVPTKTSRASSPTDLHYIMVGRTVYSRVASRWYRMRATTTPDAVDVLGLDANGAVCCTPTGVRPGTVVSFKGTTQASHQSAYAVDFRSGSSLGGTFGTIYVSTRTYLPLSYTVSTRPIATTGSFAVTYGGHFNIQAPHT